MDRKKTIAGMCALMALTMLVDATQVWTPTDQGWKFTDFSTYKGWKYDCVYTGDETGGNTYYLVFSKARPLAPVYGCDITLPPSVTLTNPMVLPSEATIECVTLGYV